MLQGRLPWLKRAEVWNNVSLASDQLLQLAAIREMLLMRAPGPRGNAAKIGFPANLLSAFAKHAP